MLPCLQFQGDIILQPHISVRLSSEKSILFDGMHIIILIVAVQFRLYASPF